MDTRIPVIVRMRVECAKCGHAEDETFEFDMPRDDSEPMEEHVPGTCPDIAGHRFTCTWSGRSGSNPVGLWGIQ